MKTTIRIRLRNLDRVVGVPMSLDPKKAAEQRRRWLNQGWDEYSTDGGGSWKSLAS